MWFVLEQRQSSNLLDDAVGLDGIGRAVGADQSSLVHNYLSKYETILDRLYAPGVKFCVLGAKSSDRLVRALAERYTAAEIIHLHFEPYKAEASDYFRFANIRRTEIATLDEASRELSASGPVGVLIEDGHNTRVEKYSAFRELFWNVAGGGVYIAEDLHAVSIPSLNPDSGPELLDFVVDLVSDRRRLAPSQQLKGTLAELRDSIDEATFSGSLMILSKRHSHYLKVSEDDVDVPAVKKRIGSVLKETRVFDSAGMYKSASRNWCNREGFGERFPEVIKYPELQYRVYDHPTVMPRQIVVGSESYLPETFRLFRKPFLSSSRLIDAGPMFAREPDDVAVSQLKGVYIHLDSEFVDTFGHTTTEVISKTWALSAVFAEFPDAKVLLSSPRGSSPEDLKPWVAPILEAAGVESSRLAVIQAPTIVETLVGITPMFSNLGYVHPGIVEVWDRITSHLMGEVDDVDLVDRRIFVDRPQSLVRHCRNGNLLRDRFAAAGFEIVRPETLTLPDQARLFRSASAVAGFGGSGLINTFMCKSEVPKLLVAPSTYNAINEALIASLKGGQFSYFYCDPDLRHPSSGWSQKAFESAFEFDFNRDGEALDAWISEFA